MKWTDGLKRTGKTLRERAGWWCAGAFVLGTVVPKQAHGQFGIDIGVILAGLAKVQSLLSSAVAGPLQEINMIQAAEQKYQQDVMYPMQAINSAKALATSLSSPMGNVKSLMNIRLSSASLPTTQQLESQLLSANPNSIATLQAAYTKVYGALPAANAAPASIRSTIDMSDAQAQDAMKKAIQLDALAARELEIASSLNQQISQAAPGSAPILEAEASAWLLQGNAYSQSGMAALLRVRSAQLAARSGAMKDSTEQTQQFNQTIQGIISQK